MNTNTRGEYPPIAILGRTRKALSKSASDVKGESDAEHQLRLDLAQTYIGIWERERVLAVRNGLDIDTTLPNWVLEALNITQQVMETA